MNLMLSRKIKGKVLDVGCGTGEHALMAAAVGLEAVGIDTSPTAIEIAMRKARDRGLKARFLVSNVLQLTTLEEKFDTILDCGMFHNLDNEERTVFADAIRSVLRSNGRYFMLCLNDERSRAGAARTVSQEEIRSTFIDGFRIDSIERVRMEENGSDGVPAWLVKISRIDIV
jgi:cyclopropane fatty-acyl-phospholipid synthase-like methyltransferase